MFGPFGGHRITFVSLRSHWFTLFLIRLVGGGGWSPTESTRHTSATDRPNVPAPGEYDDGEIGGMMIGEGNRSTRRKPAPVPLCQPQIPHDLPDRARTRASAAGSQRLTAWAMARPLVHSYPQFSSSFPYMTNRFSHVAYSSILNMKPTCSSDKFVNVYQTIWRHVPEVSMFLGSPNVATQVFTKICPQNPVLIKMGQK
jgi:hypothetical protein